MKKDKSLLKDILEEKDLGNPSSKERFEKSFSKTEKEKKKFGLIAEEIEEIKGKEELKDSIENAEDEEDADEEFGEEIEEFLPQTQKIKLESKVENLFPNKEEENEDSEDESDKNYPMNDEDRSRGEKKYDMEIPPMRMIEESELFQRKGRRGGRIPVSSELKRIGLSKDNLGWTENKNEKATKQYNIMDAKSLDKTINFDGKKEKSSFKKFEEQDYEEYDGMKSDYLSVESNDKKEGKSDYENKER